MQAALLAFRQNHVNTWNMAAEYYDLRKTLGRNVRYFRHRASLTQDVLSERCGLYRTYLSRIESGTANPTLLMLVALAVGLKVDICDLFAEIHEAANHSA